MSVTTCPRCSTQVHVPEGTVPACPSCGLGVRDAGSSPETTASPPAAKSGRWKVPALLAVTLAAIVVAALLLVSLGGDEPRALSQEEAEQTAALAMADLVAGTQAPDGGTLKSLSGTFSFQDSDFGGSGTATLELEWGRGDSGRFLMRVEGGGAFSIDIGIEAYCFPDRNVIVLGGEAYESRPEADSSCMALVTGDAPMDGLSVLAFTDSSLDMHVTPHDDGTVTATFADEEGNYTLHVDAQGRASRLEVDSPEGSGAFDISHGARGTLSPPPTTGRIPSSVGGHCILSGGSCTLTAHDGDDAPLSDFEVRLYAAGATPDDDPDAQPVAAFPLDGGAQDADGFSFALVEDGDGLFGGGDRVHLGAPGDDYSIVVWDLWADRDVRDNPTPGPALPLLALALLGAALARRR